MLKSFLKFKRKLYSVKLSYQIKTEDNLTSYHHHTAHSGLIPPASSSAVSKVISSLFHQLINLNKEDHSELGKTPDQNHTPKSSSSSSSSESSAFDWGDLTKLNTNSSSDSQLDHHLIVSGADDHIDQSASMIMDGLDTLSQVALTEPQTHYILSFDSYKPQSDSDDNTSPVHQSVGIEGFKEPATAGERTPGSPGSATGQEQPTIQIHSVGGNNNLADDTLNTPVSTSSDLSAFFSTVTSIPDPIPITGKQKFYL